ncbi:MAG: DNA gyrase inhibitor YacG [Methylohalobius sp.]|nr:DNA gyrase inhibitor YacG [Methylohalobius sp.]
MIVRCPQCGTPIKWSTENPNRPFCSMQCKLLDWGEWASGNRYIPGEPADKAQSEQQVDRANGNFFF